MYVLAEIFSERLVSNIAILCILQKARYEFSRTVYFWR